MASTADLFSDRITAVNRERFLSPRSLPLMGESAIWAENAWRRVIGAVPLTPTPALARKLEARNSAALHEVLTRPR